MTSQTTIAAFQAASLAKEKLSTTMDDAKSRFEDAGENAQDFIPKGYTCYGSFEVTGEKSPEGIPFMRLNGLCPFWAKNPEGGEQSYGYCAKLNTGDWEEDGTMLLWDMVKECGQNEPDYSENGEEISDEASSDTDIIDF
jgi:hypothetical protein